METPNGYQQIQAMFGNPANVDGTLNHAWYSAHIHTVTPPTGWKLYYQESGRPLQPITGIQMHIALKDIFIAVMNDIWAHAKSSLPAAASDDDIRAWLHTNRLDQTGGGFNFRKSTGNASKLSLHSYGIAIDWDPVHNPHKKPMSKTLPDWWYNIWQQHGWSDGRHFNTPDPMHVQFATGA